MGDFQSVKACGNTSVVPKLAYSGCSFLGAMLVEIVRGSLGPFIQFKVAARGPLASQPQSNASRGWGAVGGATNPNHQPSF